ncbi:MAG: 5-formyltetrahydrofolate cyclo-ligase [Spirochaetales bacterium]|nr:5-formyltetrahydrofolate cyclo-ligase [Spirochaetales bacterium]
MEKSALRKEILHSLISFEKKEEESRAICEVLTSLSIYKEAGTILSFVPLSTEPDISPLLSDERMLFPFITDNGEMEFGRGEMVRNKLGFYEPKDREAIEYDKAIILVPLVAIDTSFYRLGRGKGFYDRYIKRNRERLFSIALSYSPSFIDKIEKDEWDERMDAVIVNGEIKYPQTALGTGDRI